MSNELELLRKKYFMIAEILKCSLWEYEISSGTLTLIRKLDGKWSDSSKVIKNYRETARSWNIIHFEDLGVFEKYCDSMDNGDMDFEYEFRCITDTDKYEWLRYNGSTIRDINGTPVTVIGTTFNISAHKSLEISYTNDKLLDSLTHFLNREGFKKSVTDTIMKSPSGSIHSLMLIEIDNFSYINETFGTDFCNNTINKFASVLSEIKESDDIMGRYGLNKFVIFKKNTGNHNELLELSETILENTKNINIKKGHITEVSIGISLFPYSGNDFNTLIGNASDALKKSRKSGINHISIHDSSLCPSLNFICDTSELENHLCNYALDTLISSENTSEALNNIFKELGSYFELSRIYIFTNDKSLSFTANWCSNDAFNITDTEQMMKYFNLIETNFYADKLWCIQDTSDSASGQNIYSKLNIRSFIYCGLYNKGKCTGYIAFEDCINTRAWTKQIKKIFVLISKIINFKIYTVITNPEYKSQITGYSKSSRDISLTSDSAEYAEKNDLLINLCTYDRFIKEAGVSLNIKSGKKYAVLFSNITNHYEIVSEFGFNAAADMLKLFSGELSVVLKSNELLCRFHDAQFIFLYTYTNQSDLLDRIYISFHSVLSTIQDKYNMVRPLIANGLYFTEENDSSITTCIDRAYFATYNLISDFGPSYVQTAVYDSIMEKRKERNDLFEANMAEALANDEFKVFLQPRLDLRTNRIIGAEAHVRWVNEEENICFYPSQFLRVFENNGFIFDIEMYIYKKLFRRMRQWLDRGKSVPYISINVSKATLIENNFEKQLEKLISLYKIPRNLIEIEIPERLILPNISKLLVTIDSLKNKGYRIALDNFGTGISSLKLIRLLPFDIVKLDRQLFLNYNMEDTLPIIESALRITSECNIELVAVGIEKDEQSILLKKTDCNLVQGYLYYYPLSLDDFEQSILK